MILSCILVARHNIYLVSSLFTYRPTFLLASNRVSLLSFMVFIFSSSVLEQELMCFIQFKSLLFFLDLADGIY